MAKDGKERTMTISCSIPKSFYGDIRRDMRRKHYANVSEYARAAIRLFMRSNGQAKS